MTTVGPENKPRSLLPSLMMLKSIHMLSSLQLNNSNTINERPSACQVVD